MRSYSCCAHSGLSRSAACARWSRDQARCRSMRGSSSSTLVPPQRIAHHVVRRSARRSATRAEAVRARATARRRRRASSARTCSTAPSSSVNSAASSASPPCASRRASMSTSTPQCPANAISHERREQAAVGAVVVGEQQAVARSAPGSRAKNAVEPRRIVEVRRVVAELRRRPAPAPSRRGGCGRAPRSTSTQLGRRRDRCAAAASACARTSAHRRERGHDQRQRRGHRLARRRSSRHAVRIDIESLPTGMLMPSAGHSSIATARTVS